MIKYILSNLIMLICIIRMVSYGIFTIKEKNTIGGISLFVLAAAAVGLHYYIFV